MTTAPPALRIRGLDHAYGPRRVLANIHMDLPAGRTVALLGPSGCGKTTLLHLCAGLLERQHGTLANSFRRPAVMFQQPRLLPWMSTLDNIALGLKAQGIPRAQRHLRSAAVAQAMGLPDAALAQFPAELSGGMQSRAALARALVLQPDLLLMDEPFSALDVGLRQQLHRQLLARQARDGMAVLLITHDPMEAVGLADTVLVMTANPGRMVAAYHPPLRPEQRDEAMVYRSTAALLQHPQVRAAFALPPPLAAQEHGARADTAALATPPYGHWAPVTPAAHSPATGVGSC